MFIQLSFVVKGNLQSEIINVDQIARIIHVNDKPFIQMAGSAFTRQLDGPSYKSLLACLNNSNKVVWL